MPRSDFVRRHEAAFRDFHIFLVGALTETASSICKVYHLVGQVVKPSASGVENPGVGFPRLCCWYFSESSHTSVLNIGTPVAALPGAWHYRVSAGTG